MLLQRWNCIFDIQKTVIMGFLKTILIILLVYYTLKLLARWFAPKLFTYAAKKTEDHFKKSFQQYQNYSQSGEQVNEGEVSIKKKTSPQKKANTDNVGEFIDFEEIN